jgi:hypothetical protein
MWTTIVAKGYRPEGGSLVAEDGQYGGWSPTGAGTVATATDVGKFMMAQLAQDPRLGSGVANLVQQRHFTMDPRLPGMAYLFEERPRDGQRILFKDGDVPGFHSDMALLPDKGIGVYVVYNGDGTDRVAQWDGKALIDQIVDSCFPDNVPAPVTAKDPKLGSYAGTYRSDQVSRGDLTRVAGLVSSVTVSADGDGTITTNGLSQNPKVGDQRWIPLGSGEFAEQGGQDRLVFDGHGHLATTIDPTDAYYKLAWYNSPTLHLPMLYGGAGILATAFLGFPILALVRRLRQRPTHSRWARSARILACVAGGLEAGLVAAGGTDRLHAHRPGRRFLPDRGVHLQPGVAVNQMPLTAMTDQSSNTDQASKTVRSSSASRSGSARMSISLIRPSTTVKPMTAMGMPSTIVTRPGAPLTSAGCAFSANRANISACLATASAPRSSLRPAGRAP